MSTRTTICIAAVLLGLPMASAASAQGVIKTSRLSAALANDLVATAVDVCARQNQQVTAVVLDVSGVNQAMLRGDGAGINTIETAHYKAFTAVGFQIDTIDLVEQAKSGRVSSALAKVPNLLLAQGGIVIKVGDTVIGALGVSGAKGGNIDTQCARAALDKIKDQLK
jgi:uncharacterized protein GlcG (DUF336 family)